MRRRGWSGQEGLRRLRRAFLLGAARRTGAALVATAHTADDQAETLWMRLARGTSLVGLSGIAPRRGRWIRPLLEASRAEIEADLRAAGETWREDASNRDLSYERNRLRHQVIPAWARATRRADSLAVRGDLAKRLAATLLEVREARRCLDKAASAAMSEAAVAGSNAAWDCRVLAARPRPVLMLALRRIWRSTGGPGGLTAPALHQMGAIVRRPGHGIVKLPMGWSAEASQRVLRIEHGRSGIEHTHLSKREPCPLRIPGRNKIGAFDLRASWVTGETARRRLVGEHGELFAASHLKGGLELRVGRTDEWFVPFGHRRPRRLGPYLKKMGVPRASRSESMVLADRQGILWVLGLRRSARAPLTPGTRKALWIRAGTESRSRSTG